MCGRREWKGPGKVLSRERGLGRASPPGPGRPPRPAVWGAGGLLPFGENLREESEGKVTMSRK